MRKSFLIGIITVLVALVFYGGYYGMQYAYIASSYSSKVSCSCHFLSGRSIPDIQLHDLYAVPFVTIELDEPGAKVTSSVFGLAKTSAIYRKGFGCTLVNGVSEAELRKQEFVYHRKSIPHEFERVDKAVYFDSDALQNVVENAFADTTSKLQTRALIILKDGKLVVEKYAEGFSDTTRLIGWSMTKSVTNAMIGLMVEDRKLEVHAPAPVQEWQKDDRNAITLNDMLHMSSGLDFEENYSKPSDATRMLFRSYSAGKVAFESKRVHPPGEVFSYSSATTNGLQEIIRRQFPSLEAYHRFPYERLFDKIGMKSAIMEVDASGTFVGSSFMFATALDWARFGQLYLQKGYWNGEQLLPTGWTHYSATEASSSNGKYAAHFWINHHIPEYPRDGYFASGFEGQTINIIPSKNLVIVRLGCTYGGARFDNAALVARVISALR